MKTARQKSMGQRAKGIGSQLLIVALCSLSFAPLSFAADKQHLAEIVKKAVLADLVRSISENVELSGIRYLKGLDACGSVI
jgi:hypothetical protein